MCRDIEFNWYRIHHPLRHCTSTLHAESLYISVHIFIDTYISYILNPKLVCSPSNWWNEGSHAWEDICRQYHMFMDQMILFDDVHHYDLLKEKMQWHGHPWLECLLQALHVPWTQPNATWVICLVGASLPKCRLMADFPWSPCLISWCGNTSFHYDQTFILDLRYQTFNHLHWHFEVFLGLICLRKTNQT